MVRLAPWNRFKPTCKIFYWPFQGGASILTIYGFFLSCVCYAFVRVCLFVPYGHLLGKGWPLGSRLWCITVSLSLSHWYPGSGVVLDFIDSWSSHPYLLLMSTDQLQYMYNFNVGAEWFSNRVLVSRLRGCGFEFHLWHSVVSLSKTH